MASAAPRIDEPPRWLDQVDDRLRALPAATRFRMRQAYGQLRQGLLLPLARRMGAPREHETWAVLEWAAETPIPLELLAMPGIAEVLCEVPEDDRRLPPAEAKRLGRVSRTVGGTLEAQRELARLLPLLLDLPLRPVLPPELEDVRLAEGAALLSMLALRESLDDPDAPRTQVRHWAKMVPLCVDIWQSIQRSHPSLPSRLRSSLLAAALAANPARVKRFAEAEGSPLTLDERRWVASLLAPGEATPPIFDPNDVSAARELRSTGETVWVALRGGRELLRDRDLETLRNRLRDEGLVSTMISKVPAEGR